MSKRVHVVANFAVNEDHAEAFVEAATRLLVVPANQENGCLRYELCRNAEQPSRFAMIECWNDELALAAHFQQPYMADALDQLRPYISEAPSVSQYHDT